LKASKEYRDWVNKMRKQYAKRNKHKNGVLPMIYFDDYIMEIEFNRSKKNYKRHVEKKTWKR
jgi:hypothetical protein